MSTYGIEFRNADGSLALRLDECFPQTVYQQKFSGDFSGTISIPEFDSDRGMFYVEYRFVKHGLIAPNMPGFLPDSAPRGTGVGQFQQLAANPASVPSLNWDNTAKTMTIAPATLEAFEFIWSDLRSPYFLRCLHFKKVS